MKIFFIKISILSCLLVSQNAFSIQVLIMGNKPLECSEKSERYRYFDKNTYTTGYHAEFFSSKLAFIRDTESIVKIWGNPKIIGKNCTLLSNWGRPSLVSPGNNISINAISNNNCTLTHTDNPDELLMALKYKVAYKTEVGKKEGEVSPLLYVYNLAGTLKTVNLIDQTQRVWSDIVYHDTKCFMVYARWCGDGLVTDKEQCDPKDTNKTGWGNNGCNNQCKK